MLDYTQILHNAQKPGYVPPVSLTQLGATLYRQRVEFNERWPAEMRRGWIRANAVVADAQTSAYLVGQGAKS